MKDCPVILIPTFSETDNPRPGYRIGADYIQSVTDCGGLPVMLPVTADFGPQQAERWLDLADGLLLPGGGDVDPALYGEMPHPKVNAICRGLDDAELLLVKLARQRDLPIFGICRGVQTLAVAHGGTPEDSAQVKKLLQKSIPGCRRFYEGVIDGTLGCYVGPGLVGAGIQFLDGDML